MKNLSISLLKVKSEEFELYLKKLKDAVENIQNNNLDITIHFDVMDNKFVPNTGIDILKISKVREYGFYVDTHLMVEEPVKGRYIDKALECGSRDITVHIEIPNFEDTLKYLLAKKKELKGELRIGVALNPATDIKVLDKYLGKIDKVLVMSVVPGFGGQKYIKEVTEKIEHIKRQKDKIFVQVDGGINEDTIKLPLGAGADSIVIGSYLTDNVDELETRLNILNKIVKNI